MSPSDSFERSEHLSEGVISPLTILRRRLLLKGMVLGSLLALGGGSALVFWGRQYIPQYIPFLRLGRAAGRVTALAWSPDGKYLASATGVMQLDRYNVDPSTATTLQIWEAGTGKLVLTYPVPEWGTLYPPLAWSSDSQRFAWWAGVSQELSLYEAKVETPLRPRERTLFVHPNIPSELLAVAFSPDGKWLAAGAFNNGQLSVYRINNDGTPGWSYGQPWDGSSEDLYSRGFSALAWSPDSRRLVAAGASAATPQAKRSQLMIFDGTSGTPLLQIPAKPSEGIGSLAWSPDGRLIAAGKGPGPHDRASVAILNAADGQLVTAYQPAVARDIQVVGWSPRSAGLLALITSGSSYTGNTVQIWDLSTNAIIATYQHGTNVFIDAAAWSPDGRYLVTGGEDKRLCIWQVLS